MLKYPSPDPALYKALLESYQRCLKNKRHVKKKSFHVNHEKTIHQLALDIQNRTYCPGVSNVFVVTHPKPREVIAANLRDRVVHHFIYDYMAPYWERRFVRNSYACRPGKGPLQAGKDLRAFVRRHYQRCGEPLYFLQLDIQNFFGSLDLNVMYKLIERHLENPLYLWLCKTVIFHRATRKGNFVLTAPKSLWKMLPRYKSLFWTPEHIGLPIGNLTSQFFANVYMNHFDQYVAHQLKGMYLFWQRYVDDILFLGTDKKALTYIIPMAEEFLERELHLKTNRKKTLLQPLCNGLDHLGYWYKPTYHVARRRVVNNCKQAIREIAEAPTDGVDPAAACARLNSYFGYFRQSSGRSLRERLAARVREIPHLHGKITTDATFTKFVLVKDTTSKERAAARERDLRKEFAEALAATAEAQENASLRRAMAERGKVYLKNWKPLGDLLEAAGDHFRESPASLAAVPPDFRAPRRPRTPRPL